MRETSRRLSETTLMMEEGEEEEEETVIMKLFDRNTLMMVGSVVVFLAVVTLVGLLCLPMVHTSTTTETWGGRILLVSHHRNSRVQSTINIL